MAAFAGHRVSNRTVLVLGLLAVVLFSSYLFRDDARDMAHALRTSGLPEDLMTLLKTQKDEMEGIRNVLDKLNNKLDVKDANMVSPRMKQSIERNIDYMHSVDHEKFWAEAPMKVWENKKQEWIDYVNLTMPSWNSQKSKFSGRGIVLVGGNRGTIKGIKTTLSMLK